MAKKMKLRELKPTVSWSEILSGAYIIRTLKSAVLCRRSIGSFCISIFVLALSAVIVFYLGEIKDQMATNDEKPVLPERVSEWRLEKDINIPEEFLKILGTRAAALGEYRNIQTGEAFQLYLLRSSARRSSFHQPEYCYLGSGKNELIQKGTISVSIHKNTTIKIPYMLLQTDNGLQAVGYFFTVNSKIFPSYYAQQYQFLMKRIKNEKTEGMLVRIAKLCKSADISAELKDIQLIITNFAAISYNKHK